MSATPGRNPSSEGISCAERCADATVLSWIGFGVRLRFEQEPERVCFPNHRSYHEHKEHVEAEHRKHVMRVQVAAEALS